MAVKNIEININNGSTYDTLYPKTDYSNIINTPTIPSVPISIANGGTNGTTGSDGIYNLTNPCSTRSANQLNSYASSTYIPCIYGSSGYKFSLNNIMTYVNNNVSGKSCVYVLEYTGTSTRRPNMAIPAITGFIPKAVKFNYNRGVDDTFDTNYIYSSDWGVLESNVAHGITFAYNRNSSVSQTSFSVTLNSAQTSIGTDLTNDYYYNVSGNKYFMIVLYT